MQIKMTQFYCGFRNNNEDWLKDSVHEVDAETGGDLVERGFAVEVKPAMKQAEAVEQMTPAGRASLETARLMRAKRDNR